MLSDRDKESIEREVEGRAYALDAFYEQLKRLGWTDTAAKEATVAYFKGGCAF